MDKQKDRDSAAGLRRTEDAWIEAYPGGDVEGFAGMVVAGLPEPTAGFLLAFYGLVREGATDFATQAVREVTGGPVRTFGAFAREEAGVLAERFR